MKILKEDKSMKKVGLAIMRTQPLSKGHTRIISRMIEDCETVILGLGSADKHGTEDNPYTIEDRMEMATNVYGKRIKIVPLKDLGLTSVTNQWVEYCVSKITNLGMPEPTDYYTGSMADSVYYRGYFPEKNLHIIERTESLIPPATDLRTFLSLRNDGWKVWVPEVNWEIVESRYPEHLRVKG
jgi:nicotinamide mononucleotide adenylyltransferase